MVEIKSTINVTCLNHSETILPPLPRSVEKIVFYETHPWCQTDWGPLPFSHQYSFPDQSPPDLGWRSGPRPVLGIGGPFVTAGIHMPPFPPQEAHGSGVRALSLPQP